MERNVIFRPAYNRPEMLQLSIDHEIEARNIAGIQQNEYLTYFLLEYDAPKKVLEIAHSYPFAAKYRYRKRWWRPPAKRRYGITRNLLQGMKEGFRKARNHAIVIEDDILLHYSFFQYVKKLQSLPDLKNYSVLLALGSNENGDCSAISIAHHDYSPLAPVINKAFWKKYLKQFSNFRYYQNRNKTIIKLNQKYHSYWKNGYKFKDSKTYNNHDGLINRLVDAAFIEDGMVVVTPEVSRQIHIGVYGLNTKGMLIPGNDYSERLQNLKKIIADNRLNEYTKSTILSFNGFSPQLESWNGRLFIKQ